jgi:hypothetical protein
MWESKELENQARVIGLLPMSISAIPLGRNDFSRFSYPVAHLVSGNLVVDEPEKWSECSNVAKGVGDERSRARVAHAS